MKLAKQYTPNEYEPDIYALWEASGKFRPSGEGEPYSILMPPPNANANLHLGHALDMNLKDIMARYQRLRGKDTIFIPGADHAGFETWVVYEKHLEKENKSRFDFTREQLYSQIWDFVDQNRGNMEIQLRALGVSTSWEHQYFTLDKKVVDNVYATFQKLWDEGLVYRGERIVNFCTKHQTSFSDIEVAHRTEKGKLWNIAYPVLDKIGEIVVATTRPETMLGDVAVAVHPDDERYKHLVGSNVLLPILEKEIPIIADEHVDPAFGTGAVKITPAHDPNDFEIGKRHNLPTQTVINFDGTMMNVPMQFMGLPAEDARKRVLGALQAAELLRGESDIEHAVGYCYKCGTVIQPLVKDQWFVKVKPLADVAIERLRAGEIDFHPKSKLKEVIAYLEQLHDWNISRQIPWGIPIPAFQSTTDSNDWIFDGRVDEKTVVVNNTTYRREEDTFDTWFSSGQLPFITTDHLAQGELSRFFPIDFMETGSDLLRQWVSRMIMLSLYRTGKVPYKNIYLHGMVNDEKNQKMSKSKGNVVNPMELVGEFGSDAVRLGIISGRSPAQNQPFNRGAVVAGRNFCNKLWNIARFVQDQIGDNHVIEPLQPTSLADNWIIHRLNLASKQIGELIEQYRFAEAADVVYHVVWDDLADWYIEASKTSMNRPILSWALATSLQLAHPFAPFVTETIWQTLNYTTGLLMADRWPVAEKYDEIAAATFDRLQELVNEGRWVIAELPGNKKYKLLYDNDSLIETNEQLIRHMLRLESVEKIDQPHGLRLAAANREAWLDIDSDTLYQHQTNLELRLVETRQRVKNLEARLANDSYIAKAPEKLVNESRQELTDLRQLIERLMAELQVIQLN